jgi:Leucine Rich repeat
LNVLCDYFANQTSITTVELAYCHFGGMEEASRLLAAAFATNHTTTVTDLTIREIRNLQGAALGDCISGILQNNTTVQLLSLGDTLDVETVRSMQPGLRTNRHLKVLDVSYCSLRDEGLHLIVDALVGNTSMAGLSIRSNAITSNGGGLDDITRLTTRLHASTVDRLYAQ